MHARVPALRCNRCARWRGKRGCKTHDALRLLSHLDSYFSAISKFSHLQLRDIKNIIYYGNKNLNFKLKNARRLCDATWIFLLL